MAVRDDDIRPGVTLGKYEILRKLATGGMAEIYLARARGTAGFEKLLVLKRILPALANDRALVTMFLDEARLAATLQHGNICDVFDVGAEGKNYFFAMEYIHGEDVRAIRLEAAKRRQPVPYEIVLAMARGTSAALNYAHTKVGPRGPLGLVHRDVTASNILISYDGAVKLVDFGIARATTRNTKTQTGMLKGKVPYLSPEQCLGWPVDGRSDLFSLGIVLYELTTGRRPFSGINDFETMNAIVRTKAAPPSALVPGYPRQLEAIVMRLLLADVVDRYQSAAELLEELEALTAAQGLFMSGLAVAKYMQELFAEKLAGAVTTMRVPVPEEVPTAPARISGWPRAATEPYPEGAGRPPDALIEAAREYSVEVEFTPVPVGMVVVSQPAPPPPRPPTAPPRPLTEVTSHDVVLPFDPIDARSAEILDEVDVDAPADESDDDRMLRRISMLLARARAWFEVEDLARAVAAIDLAMSENPGHERAQDMLDVNHDAIAGIFTTFLGDPAGHLVLARPLEELASIPLSPRAAFLLTRLDAGVSIDDLLDISGMPRLEAQRYLCQLFLRGVVALA